MLARLYSILGQQAPVPKLGKPMMKLAGNMAGKAVMYHAILATDHLGVPFWWNLPELEPREGPLKYDLQGHLSDLPPNRFFGVKLVYYPCPFASRPWMDFEIVESFNNPLTVKDWQTIVAFRFPSLFRANHISGSQPDLVQLRRLDDSVDESQRLAGKFVCFVFGQSDMPDLDDCFSHWCSEDIFAAMIAVGPQQGTSLLAGRSLPSNLKERVEKYWSAMVCP